MPTSGSLYQEAGDAMFQIHGRSSEIGGEWFERFHGIDTATIGHFLDREVMAARIRRLSGQGKMCGPAVTLRLQGLDSTVVHVVHALVKPGDVIVVDATSATEAACWGELVTLGASARGIAGAVVDGLVTDIDEVQASGFHLYGTGLTPRTTRLLGIGGSINVPIRCGDVSVNPGDLVLGDANGVAVLGPERLEAAFREGTRRQATEQERRGRIARGELLPELSGAIGLVPDGWKR